MFRKTEEKAKEISCMKLTLNWNYLLLTMELKIIKMFGEHIDAESFKYTVPMMRIRVRKPTSGVENTSISASWINRRQWCR